MDDWTRLSRRRFIQVGTSGVALAALVVALPIEAFVPKAEPRPELGRVPVVYLGVRSIGDVTPGRWVEVVAVPNQPLLVDELRVAPASAAAFSIDRMPEYGPLVFAGQDIRMRVTNRSPKPQRFLAMWICTVPPPSIHL